MLNTQMMCVHLLFVCFFLLIALIRFCFVSFWKEKIEKQIFFKCIYSNRSTNDWLYLMRKKIILIIESWEYRADENV